MSTRTKWGFAGACLVAVGLFWGCGGELGSHSGGESHFLIQCDDTCSDGLSCVAGVCTRGCVVDEDDCEDLHPDAECSDSIEPGAVAVCDVACNDDEDCESLGTNYACESGQCRGTTRLSSGSDGGSGGGDGGTTSNDASSTTSGLRCAVLFQEYPEGAVFSDQTGCGSCVCTEGVAVCDDTPCEPGVPVFECPADIFTDPVDVKSAFVQGDVLLMEVAYGGGCQLHDFGLCYEAEIKTSAAGDPFTGKLHLIHDSHDDDCDAYPTELLHFSLQPYAEYIMQERDVAGGVVDTTFGLYPFGELTCDEAFGSVGTLVNQAAEQTLAYGCVENIDCARVTSGLSCDFTSCGEVIALAAEDYFRVAMDELEATVCNDYYENECPIPSAPPCDDLPAFGCVDGVCVEFDE